MKKLFLFALASIFSLQAFCQFEGMVDYNNVSFATANNEPFWVFFDKIPQNELPSPSITVAHIADIFVHVNIYMEINGRREKVISDERVSLGRDNPTHYLIYFDQRIKSYTMRPADPYRTAITVPCKSPDNAVLGALGAAWNVGMNEANKELNNMPPEERANVQVNVTINTNNGGGNHRPHGNHHATTNTPPPPPPADAPAPQPVAPVFCSDRDFAEAYDVVRSEPFDDNRIDLAKQIISSQNLTIEQLTQLAGIFEFEESKLEVLKFAYDFSLQKDRYYLVNKVFQFSSSKEELNEYIRSR